MNKLEKLHEFESEKKAIQFLKFKFKENEPTSSGNEISSSDEKNIQFNYKRLRRSCQDDRRKINATK